MTFEIKNVQTAKDIEEGNVHVGMCGYFSNDIDSLRRSVTAERITLRAVYAQLECTLKDSLERRFSTNIGNFSLFYPMDSEMKFRY